MGSPGDPPGVVAPRGGSQESGFQVSDLPCSGSLPVDSCSPGPCVTRTFVSDRRVFFNWSAARGYVGAMGRNGGGSGGSGGHSFYRIVVTRSLPWGHGRGGCAVAATGTPLLRARAEAQPPRAAWDREPVGRPALRTLARSQSQGHAGLPLAARTASSGSAPGGCQGAPRGIRITWPLGAWDGPAGCPLGGPPSAPFFLPAYLPERGPKPWLRGTQRS